VSVDITKLSAHLTPALQEQVKTAYHKESKDQTTAFLLCFFLGLFGAHRFYLGEVGKGLAHLALTLAAVIVLVTGIVIQGANGLILDLVGAALLLIGLIWEAVDLARIDGQVDARNLVVARRVIGVAEATNDTSVEMAAFTKLDELVHETATSPAAAPAAAAAPEGAGIITAAEVADARAMAEEADATPGASAHYSSMSRMELSDNAEEDRKEAEVRASEATVTGEPAASAALADPTEAQGVTQPADGANDWSVTRTETTHVAPGEATDIATTTASVGPDETPVAEEITATEATVAPSEGVSPAELGLGALAAGALGYTAVETVTHHHEESGYRVTDSVEDDRSYTPDAPPSAPEPIAAAAEPAPIVGEPESFFMPGLTPPEAPDAVEVADSAAPTDALSATEAPATAEAVDAMDAPTEPDVSPAEIAALAAAPVAAEASAPVAPDAPAPTSTPTPDVTDALATDAPPIADIALAGATPVRVNLPDGLPVRTPDGSPADASFLLAPEVTLSQQPAAQEYVPPTVSLADAAAIEAAPVATPSEQPVAEPEPAAATGPSAGEVAGLAGLGALAGAAGVAAGEALAPHDAPAEPAPAEPAAEPAPAAEAPAAPAMKRIRAVRRVVVDGQVVSEQVVEEIVPVDMDSATAAAELQAKLGHSTTEQIAELAHLTPEEIELRERTEGLNNG